jgi:hypothetical protein
MAWSLGWLKVVDKRRLTWRAAVDGSYPNL